MNAPVPHAALAQRADSLPATGQETSASALIEMSRVQTEAAYLFAARQPRDWDEVERRLLAACARPAFANSKRTYYVMPYDSSIHGLSIGFVEEAFRAMRNISVETALTFNSIEMEIHKVTVVDLEAIIPYKMDVPVYKTVERSRPLDNGTEDGLFISKRKNSQGKWTYLVPTQNDEDLKDKRAALVSKAIRTCGLRLIPEYIKETCIERIYAVREDMASRDPLAMARRLLVDFQGAGVTTEALVTFLGKGLDACTPRELVKLRGICDAIASGEFTWGDFVRRRDDANHPPANAAGDAGADDPRTDRKASMSRSAQSPAATPAPAAAATPAPAPTPAPSPAAAAAPAPTPAPAPVDAGPVCSEGMRKFLLKKFAAQPAKLLPALQAAGFHGLDGASAQRVGEIVQKCDASHLLGLTEAQFNAAKAHL